MALSDAAPYAVAHWALDEASGTRYDSVGSNDLTDVNTVGSGTGKFSDAADFEASNSERLTLSDNTDVSTGDVDFMLRFWIRPESLPNFFCPACKDDNSTREYGFYYDEGVALKWFVFGPSSEFTEVAASNHGLFTAGNWYLVHVWHDATANQIGISINGGTANTASHSAGVRDSSAPFVLGSRGDGALHYDGLMDDFVFLKGYILDATERTEDYNSGTGVAFADWDAGGGGGGEEPAAGTATGTATVSGFGRSLAATTSTSTGTATVAGVGRSVVAATSTVTGTATVAGVGRSIASASSTSTGTATVAGVGVSLAASAGTATGTATVSGIAAGGTSAAGTSTGTATATGVGRAMAACAGSSSGTATVAAVGQSTSASVGTTTGTSTVSAIGAALAAALGTPAGSAVVNGTAASLASAAGTSAGTSSVVGVSPSDGDGAWYYFSYLMRI